MTKIKLASLLAVSACLAAPVAAYESLSDAPPECQKQMMETARHLALESMDETRLCLQGIRTERFDPDLDCGEDWQMTQRVAFYIDLQLQMAPSLYGCGS